MLPNCSTWFILLKSFHEHFCVFMNKFFEESVFALQREHKVWHGIMIEKRCYATAIWRKCSNEIAETPRICQSDTAKLRVFLNLKYLKSHDTTTTTPALSLAVWMTAPESEESWMKKRWNGLFNRQRAGSCRGGALFCIRNSALLGKKGQRSGWQDGSNGRVAFSTQLVYKSCTRITV